MYKVVNQATVCDTPPVNGNGYLTINPNPQASDQGTYAMLVTGWSKPSKFDWDIVPNLLVKGTLYNADAGVRLLVENLSHNPHIDRVYLLALTKFDLVSQSFKAAYDALQGLGITCAVVFDLDQGSIPTVLPVSKPHCLSPVQVTTLVPKQCQSNPEVSWSSLQDAYTYLAQKVAKHGVHCPTREFTYLTNQVVRLQGFDKPEYQEYFSQWESEDLPSEDVAYSYGSRIVPQLDKLTKGSPNSTQNIITLLTQHHSSSKPAGIPCLTQLSYFRGELTAIFRSHDIGNAWLPNTQALAYLHYTWYPTLDKQERKLTIVSINAHLYDWAIGNVDTKQWVADPVGYFYFKVSTGGQYQCYHNDALVYTCGTRAGLQRYFTDTYPNLSTSHAFWIAKAISTL